jgi:hypothetical protein
MRNGLQVECERLAGDGAHGEQMLLVERVQTANRSSVCGKKSFAVDIKSSVDAVPGPGFRDGALKLKQSRVRFRRPWVSGSNGLPVLVRDGPKFCIGYRQNFTIAPGGQFGQSDA